MGGRVVDIRRFQHCLRNDRSHIAFIDGETRVGREDFFIIDVCNRGRLSRSERSFGGAVAVRVTNFDTDESADIGITERVGVAGCSADGRPVSQPLIAECSEAVSITDAAGISGQNLIFCWSAGDYWHANRGIIDVGDWRRLSRCDWAFSRALSVCIADLHADQCADVGIAQRVRAAGCSADGNSISQPLVAERSESVGIADATGVGGEDLIFGDRSGDRGDAHRGIIDVDDWTNAAAADGFRRAAAIGVPGDNGDRRTDIRVCQRVGAAGGSGDVDGISLPLVTDRPQSIEIRQRVGSRQDLIFRWRAADGHRSRRRIICICNGCCGGRANAFICSLIVRVRCDNGNNSSHVGHSGRVTARGGTADIDTISLPLIRDRSGQAVGIAECVPGSQRVSLTRCHVIDRDSARWDIIDVGHGRRLGTRERSFRRAVAVRVIHLHADQSANIGIAQRIRAAGCSGDDRTVSEPLIAEHAKAIRIADATRIGRQRLIFGDGPGDRRKAGRRVITGHDGD